MTLILLTSCSATVDMSGDGVLDCAEDEVERAAELFVTGDNEESVVEAVLAEWLDQGATLVEINELEVWSVVLDGREVGLAVAEEVGEGGWVVHDLRLCGFSDTGPSDIDGSLDCAADETWHQQAMIDAEEPGFATPELAIRQALQPFLAAHGGEIVMIDDKTGSLVVEVREQVVAHASEVPAGGWAALTMEGCGDVDEP